MISSKPTAWLRALCLRTVYIRRTNAINLCTPVHTAKATVDQTTLLDSGATENFIDQTTWKNLGVGRHELTTPVRLRNVDGTENKLGLITHFCWLRIKYNGQSKLQRFFITALGKDRMILGYPFLWTFEPRINWRQGDLIDGEVVLQSSNYKYIPLYI